MKFPQIQVRSRHSTEKEVLDQRDCRQYRFHSSQLICNKQKGVMIRTEIQNDRADFLLNRYAKFIF